MIWSRWRTADDSCCWLHMWTKYGSTAQHSGNNELVQRKSRMVYVYMDQLGDWLYTVQGYTSTKGLFYEQIQFTLWAVFNNTGLTSFLSLLPLLRFTTRQSQSNVSAIPINSTSQMCLRRRYTYTFFVLHVMAQMLFYALPNSTCVHMYVWCVCMCRMFDERRM